MPKTPFKLPKDGLVRAIAPGIEMRSSDEDDGMPTLVGHFALFDTWTEINSWFEGNFMERIAPGAFKKTFKDKRGQIKTLFQHGRDPVVGNKPMGMPEVLQEDETGAYAETPLLDTSYNRDLIPGLEAGAYGQSFAFRVLREEIVEEPGVSDSNPKGLPERTIKELELFEHGPVTWPAYADTTAGVRSMTDEFIVGRMVEDPDRLKEMVEAAVRDKGLGNEPVPNDGTKSDAAGRSEGSAGSPHPAAPEQGTSRTPAPTDPKEVRQVDIDKFLSVDELRARRDEVTARLNEINTEFAGREFSEDARSEWDGLNEEVDAIDKRVAELQARSARLAEINANQGESGPNSTPGVPEPAGNRRDGNRENLYDLASYRTASRSPEHEAELLRDGAMRAVEAAHFPTDMASREDVQGQVARLLDVADDDKGTLARRIIATGSPIYQRAFGKSITGRQLTAEEQRALSIGVDGEGGFAVPFTLDPTVILTSDGSVNPLRQISRVETIVNDEWKGVASDGITVTRKAEAAEATDDAPTLTQPTVKPTRVDGFVPFSYEAGQDWGSLQSEITRLLQEAKDDEESTAFVAGSGVDPNPEGVVAGLDAASHVDSAAVNAFAVEDVYALDDALPPRFRARARFLAAKATFNQVRQFDTQGGADLWVRLAAGTPPELIGYPAHEASEMDTGTATAAKILLLGDFRHYLIVDRVGMSVELVPHLFGANRRPTGQRGIFAFWRNSAVILADNAFRLLNIDGV